MGWLVYSSGQAIEKTACRLLLNALLLGHRGGIEANTSKLFAAVASGELGPKDQADLNMSESNAHKITHR